MNFDETKIPCPACGEIVPITSAIEDTLKAREAAREREHQDRMKKIENEVANKVSDQMKHEKAEMLLKIRDEERLKQEFEYSGKIAETKKRLEVSEKSRAELQAQQLQSIELNEQLKNQIQAFDLEKKRWEMQRGYEIKLQASEELKTKFDMDLKERDNIIDQLKRKSDDLQRALEQRSQQAQGEVLEETIKDLLTKTFPFDAIEEIAKGRSGADILQIVKRPTGEIAGRILWETKNTKAWSEDWIQKLKDDQRNSGADFAIIVTVALPKNAPSEAFEHEGLWILTPRLAHVVAQAHRAHLLALYNIRRAHEGRNDVQDHLFNYIISGQFKQRLEAIVKSYLELKEQHEKEKMSLTRIWASREKSFDRFLTEISSIGGDLKALTQNALTLPAPLEGVLAGDGEF